MPTPYRFSQKENEFLSERKEQTILVLWSIKVKPESEIASSTLIPLKKTKSSYTRNTKIVKDD